MKSLWLENARDILILPFTVTCLIPYWIFDPGEQVIPENLVLQFTGGVLVLGGLSIFTYTVFLFNRIGKGTIAPWSPKEKLVVKGPYRYTRNPMISGVWFVLLGEGLVFHSTSIMTWAGAFFIINTVYFSVCEEPDLLMKFGDDYLEYKQNVPRWIPRITPFDGPREHV